MEILLLLIGITILFIVLGGCFFFWAVRNKQFDDLDSPAHKILLDDDD